MEGIKETVRVFYNPKQNAELLKSFTDFYKLPDGIRLEKELYVEKAGYDTFLRRKMRERTPYEAEKAFSELVFDVHNHQFLVAFSKCTFIFPSGRKVSLTEYLDTPNGVTKSVDLSDSDGETTKNLQFNVYRYAEAEVVKRYLDELGELGVVDRSHKY